MLHLKTFGGLSVSLDDAPGAGAAQQRQMLALLALLAAAGRSGLSRDKVLAYLWPEADAEHARGRLKQACYALRRDLRAPDLFLGTMQLSLNPDLITSDVQAFEAALESGALEQAARIYAAPFLDGFYLSDAPEFERWVEMQRSRLRERATGALEQLATEAAADGDHRRAVEWWRRLAALDPLNSRVALSLMRALVAAGDRAGALQFGRIHDTLLRDDLDAKPDPAVRELTERLRAEPEHPTEGPRLTVPETKPDEAPAGAEERNAATVPEGSAAPIGDVRRSWMARKRVPVALGILTVGATGGWLLFHAPLGSHSAEIARDRKKVVVVLPFTNLGPADQEYFADGVTEELTARLSAVGALRVIASTSANVYKHGRKGIREIGAELGVDYVLEGSVRWEKSAEGRARVRVTPQLITTRDATHLWAEVYDEPLDEIFRVQGDIAQKVVQALDVQLLEPQRQAVQAVPTRNLEAYHYYLRGNDYLRRGADDRTAPAALRMYEKAVEVDSAFALAYAMLSRMHSRMYWFHFDHSEGRLARAKAAVARAFELEPRLPEAHQALGDYYFLGYLDYDRALREYAIAEASRPNDVNLFSARAFLRMRQGKFQEALADYERARKLDPASPSRYSDHAQAYSQLRDFAHAESLYDGAITLRPDWPDVYADKAWLYLRWDGATGRARAVLEEARAAGVADVPRVMHVRIVAEILDRRYEEAIRQLGVSAPEAFDVPNRFVPRTQLIAQAYGFMQRGALERAYWDSSRALVLRRLQARPDDARLYSALGIALAGLGRKQEAIRAGQRGVDLLPVSKEARLGYNRELDLARIYTMVGESDAAVQRIEFLLSIPGFLTREWLRIDPTYDALRGHPRFQRLLASAQ